MTPADVEDPLDELVPTHTRGIPAKVISAYAVLTSQVLYVIVVTAYLVHRVGEEVYGAFAIVLAVMSAVRLLDLGVGPTTARYVAAAHTRGELNRVVATSLTFLTGVAVAGSVVSLPFALVGESLFGHAPGLEGALLVGCIGSCLLLPLGVFVNVLYGLDRIVARNLILLARPIAALAGIIAVVEAGGGLFAIVLASVSAEVAVVGTQMLYTLITVPDLRPRRADVSRMLMRQLAPFSAGMLALSVAAQITYYSGNLIVGAALGTAAVAVFSVASRLVEGVTQLLTQFGDVFLPSFARLTARGHHEDARSILVGGTTVVLVVGYPALCVLVGLGAPLIDWWVGDAFDDAWLPLALLSGGLACTAPIRFGVLHAIGAAKHAVIARVAVLEAVANLALGIVLVNLVGMWGVALAIFMSLFVSNGLVIARIVYSQVGLSTWHDYHRRVLLALVPLLPFAAVLHLLVGPAVEGHWPLLVLACAAAYVASVLAAAVVLGELPRLRGLVMRAVGARPSRATTA